MTVCSLAFMLTRLLLPFVVGELVWIASVSQARSLSGGQALEHRRELIVNGEDAVDGRYPYFVSVRLLARLRSDEDYSDAGSYDYESEFGSGSAPAPDSSLVVGSGWTPVAPATPAEGYEYAYRHACGATLITDRLVLTAAHCLQSGYSSAYSADYQAAGIDPSTVPPALYLGRYVKLVISAEDASTSFQLIDNAALAFVHPNYLESEYQWDVAVIVLSTAQTGVRPVKIFNSTLDVYQSIGADQEFTAIGLGNVIDNTDPGSFYAGQYFNLTNDQEKMVLGEVQIGTLTGRQACAESLNEFNQEVYGDGEIFTVDQTQLCVGEISDEELREVARQTAAEVKDAVQAGQIDLAKAEQGLPKFNDTCQGDSGGPLFIKGATAADDVQVGIVSNGIGCGLGAAGVYTNVDYFMHGSADSDNFLSTIIASVHGSASSAAFGT